MGAIISNDMTLLLNKIERRLGLTVLMPHLPEQLNKDHWIDIIREDSLVTFSRFFPHKFPMKVDDESCWKKYDESKVLWYYIRDEILQGSKLLGILDINWLDTSSNNNGLGASSVGSYYYPATSCPVGLFEDISSLQMAADFTSLYNRGIYIDFQYPNRFCLRGIGNLNYDLNSFMVTLLVQHDNLSTISPTKMETFEKLAMADVAKFLYENLKYYDNLETAFINLDLKIQSLEEAAGKRDSIIEELDNAHVTTANDNIPYLWSV